jgi:hypothetical protein
MPSSSLRRARDGICKNKQYKEATARDGTARRDRESSPRSPCIKRDPTSHAPRQVNSPVSSKTNARHVFRTDFDDGALNAAGKANGTSRNEAAQTLPSPEVVWAELDGFLQTAGLAAERESKSGSNIVNFSC